MIYIPDKTTLIHTPVAFLTQKAFSESTNKEFFMGNVDINLWGIVLAVAANMVIGFVWYAPQFMGNEWMRLNGLTKKQTQENQGMPMLAMLVLAFVQAYVLRHFVAYSGAFNPTYSDVSVGFLTGLWAWVGIVLPVMGANYLFAQRRKKLLAIDIGYYLVALPVMGMILAKVV